MPTKLTATDCSYTIPLCCMFTATFLLLGISFLCESLFDFLSGEAASIIIIIEIMNLIVKALTCDIT